MLLLLLLHPQQASNVTASAAAWQRVLYVGACISFSLHS